MKHGVVRVVSGLVLGVGFVVAVVAPASAGSAGTLFGQSQSYDVLLRANGKAITTARFEVANHETEPISRLTYSLEGASLSDVSAYEQVECSLLPVLSPQPAPAPTPVLTPSAPSAGNGSSAAPAKPTTVLSTDLPECYPGWAEQTDRGAATLGKSPVYYPSGSIYHQVDVKQTGNSMTLTLAQPLAKDKSTTVLVSYVATGYITPAWGGYDFKFHTLGADTKTSDVTVAVAVDEQFQLAGSSKSKVGTPAISSSSLDSKLSAGAANSADARAYVEAVGTNGEVTKHASSLSAGETFEVSGRFAEYAIFLSPVAMSLIVVGLLALVGVVIWWARRRRKRPVLHGPGAAVVPAKVNDAVTPHGWNRGTAGTLWGRIVSAFSERRLHPRTVGWLCALLAAGLIVATSFAAMVAGDTSGYYSDNVVPRIFATMFVVATGVLAILLALVGLPVWYGTTGRSRAVGLLNALLGLLAITLLLVGFVFLAPSKESRQFPCEGPEMCAQLD